MSETKTVMVICPKCSKSKKIPFPSDAITKPDGLTTINVPADIVCEHSFQLYLDQNFSIRGYQQSDFEINIVPGGEKQEPIELTLLFELFKGFGQDSGAILLESLITSSPVFIIGVPTPMIEQLSLSYLAIFENMAEKLILTNRIDYNKSWKNRVYSREFMGSYVFDWELFALIKGSAKKSKHLLGRVIWDNIVKARKDKAQRILLTNWIKKLEKFEKVTLELIEKNKKIKKKEIIKFLQQNHKFDEKIMPISIIGRKLVNTLGSDYQFLV
jgi:hypothetical protein